MANAHAVRARLTHYDETPADYPRPTPADSFDPCQWMLTGEMVSAPLKGLSPQYLRRAEMRGRIICAIGFALFWIFMGWTIVRHL